MRFSLIVPFKKGGDFLKDCLESLKDQVAYTYLDGEPAEGEPTVYDLDGNRRRYSETAYRDFEVILVLDHPTEDVSETVAEYSKEYTVRTIAVDDNTTGVSAARNVGIAAAEGEYLYFLDSDDYLAASALFMMEEGILDADGPDIAYAKKRWTWYSRNGFLATQQRPEEEEDDETAEEAAARAEEKREAKEQARADARDRDEEMKSTLSDEEYLEFRRQIAARRLIYKRKGIGNISALAIAFKRSFILANGIVFPVNIHYYADCSFLCRALYLATTFRKVYRSKYIKRKHGDPINFPSLAQENAPERFDELIAAYGLAMDTAPEGNIVRTYIDRKFIYYYTGFFVMQLRRRGGDIWRTTRFEAVRELMRRVPKETIKNTKLYRRRLIRALLAGDVDKAYRIISTRLGVTKLGKCIISRGTRIKAFYQHIFLKKPVEEKWVMFECFFGKSYGDNPKGIYEYMAKNLGNEYKLIWSMERVRGSKIPYAHKTVKRGGLRYAYYLARCKYFVFNTKQIGWFRKRPDQIFLETWHGTPLKRLAFDMEDNFSAAPGYKQQIYGLTRKWDYLVSANSFSSEVFRSCFMYNGKMLEYGYPRNDILHRPDRDELAASIKKKLGIPLDKKTILYAPTWRDDEFYGAGQYKFTLKLELPKLKAAIGDEYVILLRTHYYIADKLDVTGMEGFAYNLSKYDDIADIYLISDICITDYSSVFFDYANLKRPMLFYTYDMDKYRDMLRGFYFDMESTVPGPLLYTTEEVIDAIKNIDTVAAGFADRYDAFYERFCGWENGKASENIVKEVILKER